MRQVLRQLAARCPVCVVSGRDRRVVQELMGMEDLVVAGSHGFDIWTPSGPGTLDLGAPYRAQIERAAATLRQRLAAVSEAEVEVKNASVAAHFRRVPPDRQALVRAAVDAALAASGGGLRVVPGRMVYELRPDLDWDKGKAVLHLLRSLGLDGQEVVALYLGDDLTDEDAFRALAGRGIGILVGDLADPELAGRTTWAEYRLQGIPEVQRFLDRLAGWIDDRGVTRP
jgi:trehalose 6-phosphate phosphatase